MLTTRQQLALEQVKNGHNVYIGGQAGVGKSFIVNAIAKAERLRGKKVALTCTTGIACSVYNQNMGAMTIHKWSGLGDGCFSGQKIKVLLQHDEAYIAAKENILKTDLLIIDEISMFSAQMLNNLHEACSIRSDSIHVPFGGLQVVLVGDFTQLPPVRHLRYGDMGSFCFESEHWPQHSIFLTENMRQRETKLCKVVNALSVGRLDDEIIEYMIFLSRQLVHETRHTIKLFSNNLLVDMFNREKTLIHEGELFCFEAIDEGLQSELDKIIAPRQLWLKVGIPVMLLRNLTDKLVNGLLGKVVNISQEHVSVHFTRCDIVADLSRVAFTVYDPMKNRNVAARNQIPLKIAFALTIHKAQGMTLESVEVDCQSIFQAGQLAVAMGRVKEESGLRVVNFNRQAVIPQPKVVLDFLEKITAKFCEDLSCCHPARQNDTDHENQDSRSQPTSPREPPTSPRELSASISQSENDIDFEETFAEQFIAVHDDTDIHIPEFDFHQETLNLRFQTPVNSFQRKTNQLVEYLLQNTEKLITFVTFNWINIGQCFEIIHPEEFGPVPERTITSVYQKCHQYMTSDEYKQSCFTLFDIQMTGEEDFAPQFHVCFNIILKLRKIILKIKTRSLPVASGLCSSRSVDSLCDTARGKIRYIGGYVVAKLHYQHTVQVKSTCFKTSAADKNKYDLAKESLVLLDIMKASEITVMASSSDVGSLKETERKQNLNRSLINITDEAFHFTYDVVEESLKKLTWTTVSSHGANMYEFIFDDLKQNVQLYEKFTSALQIKDMHVGITDTCSRTKDTFGSDIPNLVVDMVKRITAMESLFHEFLHKILDVLTKQFTQDMLSSLQIKKKMEHRKQIQVKVNKKNEAIQHLSMECLLNDKSENKKYSHSLLQCSTIRSKDCLIIFEKKHLLLLSSAYGMQASIKAKKKSEIATLLADRIISSPSMPHPQFLQSDHSEPSSSTTTAEAASSVTETIIQNVNNKVLPVHELVPNSCANDEQVAETDSCVCGKCGGQYKNTEDWIQCDNCLKWFHRKCGGLSNVLRKYTKADVQYWCPTCSML